MTLRIVKSGALTTVQDLGRYGAAHLGVPPSGALDTMGLEIANRCVGNLPNAAGLEFTLSGPTILFEEEAIVALAGARFLSKMTTPDRPVPRYQAFCVERGTTLTIGAAADGTRGYLAVRGGVKVKPVLGSCSTYLRAGLGGYFGRALRVDDVLSVADSPPESLLMRWHGELWEQHEETIKLRVMPASQTDFFFGKGLSQFFGQEYTLRPESDRMGFRLSGHPIELNDTTDILSEPSFAGNIQIASGGLPIILGRDLPATGGYAKIATIYAADFGKLAYVRAGQKLQFIPGSWAEARTALIAWRKFVDARFEQL